MAFVGKAAASGYLKECLAYALSLDASAFLRANSLMSNVGPQMPMTVEPLKPEHARQYRALMLEAYAQAPDAFTSTPEERAAEPESWWVKRIADPSGLSVVFGVFVDQQLVGAAALEFSAKPKTRHKAHLIGMYMSPTARGTGAGTQLVQAAIGFARAREGTTVIRLTVTEGNKTAIGLYRAAGFVAFGTEPMAILAQSGYKAKVHMWLQLQGEDAAVGKQLAGVAASP